MSVSVRHPQITQNTRTIENNDNIPADRREQRETTEQTGKSSSSHQDIVNTDSKRKPFSRKLNAYLKDMTTRETTKTTTSGRSTSRYQQQRKLLNDKTINKRHASRRHYNRSSASLIGCDVHTKSRLLDNT
jgi:hypothetical protein